MSSDMNRNLGDSGRNVARGARAAGRAGTKAARAAVRKGRKTASSFLPLKAKIAIAAILAFVLLIAIVGGGTSSSQMDENFYYTAMDEEKTNMPDTEADAQDAMYDVSNALKQTADLASIIHEAKREERQRLEGQISKSGDNATVICETDSMPIYVNSEFPTFVGTGNAGHAAAEWGRARAAEAKGKWYYVHFGKGGTGPNGVKKSTKCPICHPLSNNSGWQCIGFVTACYYHGAGVESDIHGDEHCHLGGLGTGADGNGTLDGETPEEIYGKWKKRNGENWQMISAGSLKSGYLEASQLQEGDVLLCYDKSGHCFHMALYLGGNQYVDSSRANSVNPGKGGVQIHTYGKRPSVRIAMRYTGGSSIAGSSSGAEAIALTAEKYAWPLGTAKKKYTVGKGGSGYNGFTQMYQRHMGSNLSYSANGVNYTSHIRPGACCCHSANSIVSEALGISGRLPSLMTPTGEKKRKLEKKGFVIMNFNGSTSELQRGDILTYKKNEKNGGGHVFIYLGKGSWGRDLVCHGGLVSGKFPHIDKWPSGFSKSGKSTYLIIRYTGGSSLYGTTSYGGYSPKTEYTELGVITSDTGTRMALSYPSDKTTAQSFTYTGNGYAVSFMNSNSGSATGTVRGFTADGNVIKSSDANGSIYHANGTCSSAEGTVLVAGSLQPGRRETAVEFTVSEGKLSKKGDKTLPATTSSLAYDRETGKYILSAGSVMKVYDSTLTTLIKTIRRNKHGTSYQDIGAGGGYIFACHTPKKGGEDSGENYVDVYDEETGSYCGSYHVSYGELESADVVNGELVLLVHIYRSRKNYIQKTGIIINAGAGGVTEGVTKSDLDILAAYSVTLSNSGLYKHEEGTEKSIESDSGLFSTEKYTDINGRRIKTYRLGEKKGRINYPKDLKNRIKNPLKSFRLGQSAIGKTETSSSSDVALAAIEWATSIANDDTYTYGKGYRGYSTCCVCANCTKKSDKKFTCMPFLAAAYAHASGESDLMDFGSKGRHVMHLNDKNFEGTLGKYWKKIGLCKNLTIADLQPGDVVIKWSATDDSGHAWMYGGGDLVIEAVPSDIRVVNGAASKLKSYGTHEGTPSKNYVMRYVGGSSTVSSSASAAEAIAQTAEALAWPYGHSSSDWKKPYGEVKSAAKKVGMTAKPDCGNFVQIVTKNALGNKDLPDFFGKALKTDGDVSEMNSFVSSYGFTASSYDGNISSLQRGDILVRKKHGDTSSGRGQHIFIYLGNGYFAEASHPSKYYGRVTHKNSLSNSDYKLYYVIRSTSAAAAATLDYTPDYDEGAGGLFYKILSGDKAIEAMKADGIDTTAAESKGTKIIYLQERPVSYICEHLFLIDPNAKYSGASTLKRAKSNLAAIYALSDNTEHLLYTGTMDPSLLGMSGGIYGTGSLALPLPPGSFVVTSHVGTRESPGQGASTNHKGVDMGCPTGTPIYASLAGQVTTASWYGGYGNCVIIESGSTGIIYGHMSKILVKKGDYVTQGQTIGQAGNTGISFGSHLHFEVHQNGKVVDPEPLLGLR